MSMTSRIAISIGDPAGIGPEVVLRALLEGPPGISARVFGPVAVFEKLASDLGVALPTGVCWEDQPHPRLGELVAGRSGALAGEIQVRSLEAAFAAVRRGEADALCTAPITKASARAASFPFPGHTEYLAHGCGQGMAVMMLAGPGLRVVPLTGHVPLCEVARCLDRRLVVQTLLVTARGLRDDLGVARPRMAVAGINPHAGEGGMLGEEERTLLLPAMQEARVVLRAEGIPAELTGPLPADGLFAGTVPFDAVICAYHDQAMIPIKMRHMDQAVNITLGLPIVRTSPAHGSALDIAGRGLARPGSMLAALRMAAEVANRRGQRPVVSR